MSNAAQDRRVIACNHSGRPSIRAGALCYLMLTKPGNGHDRIKILARSRSGRWIAKWEDMKRLSCFRFKTLPPEHPLYADERITDGREAWLAELTAASN